MHRAHPITCALLAGTLLGCGSSTGRKVATTPASQRVVQQAGRIVVRGDYGPDRHGPFALHGTYRVTFVQRGAGVDFTQEVPFTAHLEQPVTGREGRQIKLFERAARSGATTITANGRFDVVVDFGDSPYEIVLLRMRGAV